MRKSLLVLALLGAVGFALPAKAQTAQGEVFFGYTYTNLYVNSGAFDATGRSVSFPFNGGIANGQYNLNDYLSVFGYFGGGVTSSKTITQVGGGSISSPSASYINYGGGPRLYISRSRIAPFMEVGLGAATASTSFDLPGSHTAFQLLAGGGVDVVLTNRISIRPIEFDYVLTKFPDGQHNIQNGYSYTGGVIIRFGTK